MLSFSEKSYMVWNKYRGSKSLQVPCSPLLMILKYYFSLGKRVLPFTSVENAASITVETALVLPIFLFLSLAILAPISWLDRQRKVQMTMESFSEKLSQYAYIKECWGEDIPDEILGINSEEFSGSAAKIWLIGKLEKTAGDVTVKKADVPDEDAHVCFEVEYREKIPYFSAVKSKIYVRAAVKKRCWTGVKGKLKMKEKTGEEGEMEKMVYVGAGMGRYHLNRNCHYISNEYKSVRLNQIDRKRITPCSICAKDCKEEDEVYITSSGRHYHKIKSCRAMTSYVREVPLREVEHIGACSYCSGK